MGHNSNAATSQQSSLGSTQSELNLSQSSLYDDGLKQDFNQVFNLLEDVWKVAKGTSTWKSFPGF